MCRAVLIAVFTFCISAPLAVPAASDEAKARLARIAWSAFQCHEFASLADKKQDVARLFEVGLQAGREFLEALKSGNVTRQELSSMVPMGVSMLLSGPSNDFVLGRIYSNATQDAHDKITKERNGIPLPPGEWLTSEEAQRIKASTFYLNANCELIK